MATGSTLPMTRRSAFSSSYTRAAGCASPNSSYGCARTPLPNERPLLPFLEYTGSGRSVMRLSICELLLLACGLTLHAADKPVSFASDIGPVFESTCWKCHGGAVQLSKLDLRTRDAA